MTVGLRPSDEMALRNCSSSRLRSSSARLRALMSTIALRTKIPSPVSIGTQPDFDRNLGALFLASKELASRPHRSRGGGCEKSAAEFRVLQAKPLRYQHLDWIAEQLVTRVAEQAFDFLVHENDTPFAVDH